MIANATLRKESPSLFRSLERIGDVVERLAPVFAILIVALFAAWTWMASRVLPFQFDELLELGAATAATPAELIATLASGVDFNPPLSHFAIRGAMALFGNSEWPVRLPAFLGMATLLVCLYAFVARQFGRTYGLLAMLFVVCLPVRNYAVQGRPYGMLLGFTGLSLILFQESAGKWRAPALAGLALCTAALAGTHYYAVLVIGVLFAAGLARAWARRSPDWPLLISCSLPPLVVLGLLRHVITQQRSQLTHYFARGTIISFDHGYDDLTMDPLIYCVALLIISALLAMQLRRERPKLTVADAPAVPLDMIVLACGLLSLPLVGALVTQFVTHAYLTRYFLAASIGFALCACYGLKSAARFAPGVALVTLLCLGMGFGKALFQEAIKSPETLPALLADGRPILFDTPESYLQIYHYQPAMRANIRAIADPPAAMRYRHYDTDDRIMIALAAHHGADTVTMGNAIRQWPSFRLVPRSADSVWALKCLMESGARVSVKQSFGSSNFLFDVNVRPENIPLIDSCSSNTPGGK